MNNNPRTRGDFFYLNSLRRVLFYGDDKCTSESQVNGMEWNGEPFNRVIEAENINDCYDHWMIWAQIAHADITNIRIEELKEHQAT